MTQDGDKQPKMDEILASIRRIISDEGTAGQASSAPDALPEDDPEDVLELTPSMATAGIASDKTAAAASESLSTLSDLVVRNYEGSQNTLEALVRELLKPMLREWLDANLPEIVEKTVTREVERITRRGL